MKLCVIGDSHIAALKLAWPEAGQIAAGIEPTWFWLHASAVRSLRFHGDRVSPRDRETRMHLLASSGTARLQISDYDAFLVVGLMLRPFDAARVARRSRKDSDLKSGMRRTCRAAPGIVLAKALRRRTARPIVVMPAPVPSRAVLTAPGTEVVWMTRDGRTRLIALYRAALQAVAAAAGLQVAFPPNSMSPGGVLRDAYATGATKRGRPDFRHGNSAYGARVLQFVLPTLVSGMAAPGDSVAHAQEV
jgi:hypothetical protein